MAQTGIKNKVEVLYKKVKMKKAIYLIGLLNLISCNGQLSFPSTSEEKHSVLDYDISEEPKIYLSREDKFVNINTLNREDFLLSLSDKFIFSERKQEDKTNQAYLDKIEFVEKVKSLKVKISSFCSYEKRETEQESNTREGRIVQEFGSQSYIWSFSVFELLPEAILLSHWDKIFYCSFIFAFKEPQGGFNYYNIAQQPIEPSFVSEQPINELSLVRETESGSYLPITDEVIEEKDLYKILLLNNTGKPVENYHLFCEGLKIIKIPGVGLNTFPLFVNLMNLNLESSQEDVKKCRVFSKNNKKITGMTNPFGLDLNSLRSMANAIDLKEVNELVVMDENQRIKKGNVPLNSYFYFINLDEVNHLFQDYSSISIEVDTQCFNTKIFGKTRVMSKTYSFSFREKFPVMAVTPEEIFIMDIMSYKGWLDKKRRFLRKRDKEKQSFSLGKRAGVSYKVFCIYEVKLVDRHKPENKREFEKRVYQINWNEKSYGIDYRSLNSYESVSPFVDSQKEKSERRQFLRLEDVDSNKAGYLEFNFFDVVNDKSFPVEGYKVDHMTLKCHSGKNKDGSNNSIAVSWPYNVPHSSISLKTFFVNSNVREYITTKTLVLCRLILYEDKILRYFSGEMKITK